MATRARQALETECSLIQQGHDDTDAAQALAAQLTDEMKRRERRLLKRMGEATRICSVAIGCCS